MFDLAYNLISALFDTIKMVFIIVIAIALAHVYRHGR